MSTDYRPLTPIRMTDLFDGHLERFGVHEKHHKDTTHDRRCLTDGLNFLWVDCDEEGLVTSITRHGMNAPQRILRAIGEEFDAEIVSEHEPKYWGYATKEEWYDDWAAISEENKRKFYDNVIKFVRGEEHDITPGTIGMIEAEIAKRLVAENPELLSDDKRSELIKAIKTIYDRDHAITVTLTEEEIAFVRTAATHEDDLNKG